MDLQQNVIGSSSSEVRDAPSRSRRDGSAHRAGVLGGGPEL